MQLTTDYVTASRDRHIWTCSLFRHCETQAALFRWGFQNQEKGGKGMNLPFTGWTHPVKVMQQDPTYNRLIGLLLLPSDHLPSHPPLHHL